MTLIILIIDKNGGYERSLMSKNGDSKFYKSEPTSGVDFLNSLLSSTNLLRDMSDSSCLFANSVASPSNDF